MWANFKANPFFLKLAHDSYGGNTLAEELIAINNCSGYIYFLNSSIQDIDTSRAKAKADIDFLHYDRQFDQLAHYCEKQRSEIRNVLDDVLNGDDENLTLHKDRHGLEIFYEYLLIDFKSLHFGKFKEAGFNTHLTKCNHCEKFFYQKKGRKPSNNIFCSHHCRKQWLQPSSRKSDKTNLDDLLTYIDLIQSNK